MTSPRDLADELLTLQPVDPARCNTRRKAHPVIGGRALECSECWRERVAERLEQWRRSIEGQAEAENGPSRVADGLAGSDRHSGTGEARKSADSAESVNVTIQDGRLVVRIRGAIVEAEPQDARLDVIRAGMPEPGESSEIRTWSAGGSLIRKITTPQDGQQ